MTTPPRRTPEQEAERAERAEMGLRNVLRHLSRESSVAGVKAALALAHCHLDGLDVPAKVLETIDSMDKQETMSGPETVDNQ